MSEPSLRNTVAQAIGRAYWRSQNQPNRAVRASEWYPEADAALSVIRTQRDAIAQAIAPHIDPGGPRLPDRAWCDERDRVALVVADAVLAVLGGGDDP